MNDNILRPRPWLKEARERAGLSRRELAGRLNVTWAAVHHWESGRRIPNGPTRQLLCLYLGLSRDQVDDGFDGTEAAA